MTKFLSSHQREMLSKCLCCINRSSYITQNFSSVPWMSANLCFSILPKIKKPWPIKLSLKSFPRFRKMWNSYSSLKFGNSERLKRTPLFDVVVCNWFALNNLLKTTGGQNIFVSDYFAIGAHLICNLNFNHSRVLSELMVEQIHWVDIIK